MSLVIFGPPCTRYFTFPLMSSGILPNGSICSLLPLSWQRFGFCSSLCEDCEKSQQQQRMKTLSADAQVWTRPLRLRSWQAGYPTVARARLVKKNSGLLYGSIHRRRKVPRLVGVVKRRPASVVILPPQARRAFPCRRFAAGFRFITSESRVTS